ncbi:MAG TPA: transporter [Longimicrobium sp.]|nr:transporter [Longimicrobium sp.]
MFLAPLPSKRIAALLAAAFLLSAGHAAAQAGLPVSTSRMGVVKGPGVVAAGVLQVEAGYSRAHREGRTRHAFGETLLRVGLGRDTELRATFPSYLRTLTPGTTTEGASDAALALKHRFRQPAGWMPGISLTVGSTLPTGADAFSAGQAQPEAIAAAEWRLPHRVALGGIAGHRHAVLAGDRFGQNTLGAAARADVTPAVAAQLEYSRVSATRAGAVDAGQLRATAALRLTRDLQLDGWAGRTTQTGVPAETQFGLGFTRRW